MLRRKDAALRVEPVIYITSRLGESRDDFIARLTASTPALSAAERERIGNCYPMGRQPGSSNSPEHNERIAAAIQHRYQDDPDYQLMLNG